MLILGPTELIVILVIIVVVVWMTRRFTHRKHERRDAGLDRERTRAVRQAGQQTDGSVPARERSARRALAGPFAEVERQVEELRRQVVQGLLSEADRTERLRELMIQDAEGNWWTVSYEGGEWCRHDGTEWVRADPPSESEAGVEAAPRHGGV